MLWATSSRRPLTATPIVFGLSLRRRLRLLRPTRHQKRPTNPIHPMQKLTIWSLRLLQRACLTQLLLEASDGAAGGVASEDFRPSTPS